MPHTDRSPQTEAALRERRETPRVHALGRLHGHVMTFNAPVSVRELGLGGFSIQSTRAFEVEDVHDVRVSMKDGVPVTLRGRVVYCRPEKGVSGGSTFITGFALLEDTTSDVADALGSLIDAITGSLSFDVA